MVGWKRIVVTVGEKIGKTHLTYAQGACAEITAAATIAAADGYGLPVSTTHVLSSGIAGTMTANGSGLQWSTVRNIAMAWVLTLPAAMIRSGTLYTAAGPDLGRTKSKTPALQGAGVLYVTRLGLRNRLARTDYSCPYLRSTTRQLSPTRQLWAASVAPQCKRLFQLIPPERSHSLAAAGRHGASSARSTALAAVAETPNRMHAAMRSFIFSRPSNFCRGAILLPFYDGKGQLFGAAQN